MMKIARRKKSVFVASIAVGLMLAGCATSSGSGTSDVSNKTVIDKFGAITTTVGPKGEASTEVSSLTLTPDEAAKIKDGHYRAAILWHELSAWTQAIQDGITSELKQLGIDVVATADAKFDAATQANQILSTLALKPDVILGQAVDPVTGGAAYQPAVNAGVKLIFADQAPDTYVYGKQYQAIITDNLYQIGQFTGAAMCKAVGDKGEVGILYYDADFHVTNFRDAAFQQDLMKKCPNAKIVSKEGFSDPNKAEEIANGMIAHHPNLSGIYVSWAVPAQGVLAALRNAGNTKTKIVTIDLDDTIATDMAGGGHTAAIIADQAFQYGKAMGMSAAYSILGKKAPEYGIVNEVTVTKNNLKEGYAAWNEDVPKAVLAAVKK
jgi:ribose transport system substrate-binding protein